MAQSNVLITGGAGFIGSNLANELLKQGHTVTIFDNLSRMGCEANLHWLREQHGPDSFRLVEGNVSDFDVLCRAAEGVVRIYHLAGQVAVTTSVAEPRDDFTANALGTFNALEAARLVADDPIFIYSSTNKVYGGLENVGIIEEASRYCYATLPCGIPETQQLDFHSPYGCSKGAGDQYVRDYTRIYGYRQFGIEDQGWLAWFTIAALKGRPITIYGDGKQVRDVLFIDDLLAFYDAAIDNIETAAGQIYNVGGGPECAISIWAEFGPLLEKLLGQPIEVHYADERPGDQLVYISDIRKASTELGWQPQVSVEDGLHRLSTWIKNHLHLFDHLE